MVCEAVRRTEEQGLYEAVERGQGKTTGEAACATCQRQQVYTQGIWMDSVIPKTAFSQVRVLSHGEKGILLPLLMPTTRSSDAVALLPV